MPEEVQDPQKGNQTPNKQDQDNIKPTESQTVESFDITIPTYQQRTEQPTPPLDEQPPITNVPSQELQNNFPDLNTQQIGQTTPPNNTTISSVNPATEPLQTDRSAQQSNNATPLAAQKEPAINPMSYVLQWVTYALWGWTLVALSFLIFVVFNSIFGNSDTGDIISYSIAAVLVLLPISYVCDRFYAKIEPQQKKGVAMAIMLIHAVIFTLFGVGFVIGAVFSLVAATTGESGQSGSTFANVLSCLIIAIMYGVTLLRTINLINFPFIRRFYPLFMTIVIGVIALAGILGPARTKAITKNDRLIESNIQAVNGAIQSYVYKNKALPESLSDLSLSDNAKLIIDKNLVVYKKGSESTGVSKYSGSSYSYQSTRSTNYNYELCATFARASTKNSNSSSYSDSKSYISAYSHKQGEVCYSQTATSN